MFFERLARAISFLPFSEHTYFTLFIQVSQTKGEVYSVKILVTSNKEDLETMSTQAMTTNSKVMRLLDGMKHIQDEVVSTKYQVKLAQDQVRTLFPRILEHVTIYVKPRIRKKITYQIIEFGYVQFSIHTETFFGIFEG